MILQLVGTSELLINVKYDELFELKTICIELNLSKTSILSHRPMISIFAWIFGFFL